MEKTVSEFGISQIGVSQNVIPYKRHLGGAVPFAFTENGSFIIKSAPVYQGAFFVGKFVSEKSKCV